MSCNWPMFFPTSSICALDVSNRPSCCPTLRIVSDVDANDVFIVCWTLFSPADSRWSSPSMRCSSDCCVIATICAMSARVSTRGARSRSHASTPTTPISTTSRMTTNASIRPTP